MRYPLPVSEYIKAQIKYWKLEELYMSFTIWTQIYLSIYLDISVVSKMNEQMRAYQYTFSINKWKLKNYVNNQTVYGRVTEGMI